MSSIKLNITGVCKGCSHFEPKIEVVLPGINEDGHFRETGYRTWCSHDAVCWKRKKEKEEEESCTH